MKAKLKKMLSVLMSLAMVITLFAGTAVTASADPGGDSGSALLPDGAGSGIREAVVSPFEWELKEDEASGTSYWELDTVYVKNPTVGKSSERGAISDKDDYIQHIRIYAPENYLKKDADGNVILNTDASVSSSTGLEYTAENAPVIYRNYSGGYTSSTIKAVDPDFIEEGYVLVNVQTRGKEITDLEGKYIGQFPVLIADLKAGIRFLKYFDDVLPGDSESIVSTGHSSGGAVSAMLGASGDSAIFDPYLKEIGAYDASDVVYIAHASAPITNLSSADASYEWYQKSNPKYFLFNAMAFDMYGNKLENFPVGPMNKYNLGSNILGGAHEDELSELLYDWFVDYVQDMDLDLGDDGRSGEFYDGFVEIYEKSLEEYIARYNEVGNTSKFATAQDYLDNLGSGWFTYDSNTGKVEISDLDTLVQNHIARKKMCPSLDSYNYKSNENDAFKDADGNVAHFSNTVAEMLRTLVKMYEEDPSQLDGSGENGEFTEKDFEYLKALADVYSEEAVNEHDVYMLEVMSPINYVIGKEGFEATSAPHWRLRVGSEDGDHGAPAAWLIYEALQKYHPEVDSEIGVAWGFGHEWAELTKQDFFDYIARVLIDDGRMTVAAPEIAGTIILSEGKWIYVGKDGQPDFEFSGFADNENGRWKVEKGVVNFSYKDIVWDENEWRYYYGGKFQDSYTGVTECSNIYGWWYVKNGVVDFTANTVASNTLGWWYVESGKVDFSFNEFADNSNGRWKIEGGKVNFSYNDIVYESKEWRYYYGGKFQNSYTGVTDCSNANGWWYVKNGVVDFSADTVAANTNGWWKVTGGKVDFTANTVAANTNGWWKITNGKVDFSFNGLASNANGWWKITNGKVDFSFNGLATNQYGTWVVKNGKVDFGYNSSYTYGGKTYTVKSGKVQQ